METDIEKILLGATYDAELQVEYSKLLQNRYEKLDVSLRMAAGVMSASMVGKVFGNGSDLWLVLSAVGSVLATVVLPTLKLAKLIVRIEDGKAKWVQLAADYADAVRKARLSQNWTEAEKDYRGLKKRDVALEAAKGSIPESRKLLLEAQRRVCARHGFPRPAPTLVQRFQGFVRGFKPHPG